MAPSVNGSRGEAMGRLIEFYIPENHKPKIKWTEQTESGRVLEFRPKTAGKYTQVTWIFPEIDADLA